MAFKHFALLCTLPMLALGVQKRATLESFALYGYGKGISGLPLFYADGMDTVKRLELADVLKDMPTSASLTDRTAQMQP